MSHIDTISVHAGYSPDAQGAVMPPIYTSSTYAQRAPGDPIGFEYARSGNPTRQAFESALAEVEGGTRAFAFASGMAAMATVLELLDHGGHVIALDDLYGGAWRLFERVRTRSAGLQISYVAPDDIEALKAAFRPDTKMVWLEVPTNPLLKIADLEAVVGLAHSHGALAVADATFSTPYLLRPLDYGFDLVVHSVTKYLNGHSDVIGGAAIVRDAELGERLGYLQNAVGGVMDPFSSFLALRGLRTLPLRMGRHSENALQLAQWLEAQPQVARVLYPGLASHPQHALAAKQFKQGFGGMLSLELASDDAGVRRFLAALRYFTLAESLGGVESLISQPFTMSHSSLPEDLRRQRGIEPTLLRVSIGIEHADDLQADLAQGLKAI
ncbi:trans-sulfuration enzyme family protein [Chitinimonas lacunae]|uniref:Trans-sulfuration enzyme family protein n=1 Tax=Chitinimonas lacunae TaxID=1963018 RepID=A0ABV8MU24_9NEIS